MKRTKKKDEQPKSVNGAQMWDRVALINAIEAIKPAISKATDLTNQSDLVLFDENRVVSFNDEIAISFPIDCVFQGGIIGDELLKLLKKIPAPFISYRVGKSEEESPTDNQLIIEAGKTTAGFNLVQDVNIPTLGTTADLLWEDLPEGFLEGVGFSLFSAANDPAKGVLNNVFVTNEYVYSSDNFRLTRYKMKESMPYDVLIPVILAKLFNDRKPTQIGLPEKGNWIHFRNENNLVLSSRTVAGEEFPDSSDFFNQEGEEISLPDDIGPALQRTEIMAEGDHPHEKRMTMQLSENEIICKGQGPNGWIKEKIKCEYDGPELTIITSPIQLLEILNKTKQLKVCERFLVFETDVFSHVVAKFTQE